MLYIVQENLWNERNYIEFVDSIKRLNLPYEIVKVIPFIHELAEPLKSDHDEIVAFGSTTLMRISQKLEWSPGIWFNENFNTIATLDNLGCDYVMNPDQKVYPLKDVPVGHSPMFYRPVEDLKAFSGQVMDSEEFIDFRDRASKYGDTVTAETMVSVSSVRNIYSEYRCFIVDGELITYSQYKQGSRVVQLNSKDDQLEKFASKVCDCWLPAPNVVLDIGINDRDEYKVIEFNCINSSGFYSCDMSRVLEAIER
jgi:hypothetical protein